MKNETLKNRKTINFIISDVVGSLICILKGHNPEKHLTETDGWISTKRCSRCKCQLGLPHWKFKQIPPPQSNKEQIMHWEQYCEERWQSLRESCQ